MVVRARRIAALTVLAGALLWTAPVPARGAPGEGAAEGGASTEVRLRGERVLTLAAPLDGVAAPERARRASEALAAAMEAGDRKVSVRTVGREATVLVGERAVLRLGPADAAASGVADTAAHVASVVASVERALRDEDRRAAAQAAVFAFSMLVFSALVAFLVARRVAALAVGWAERIETGEAAVPALTAGGAELVSEGFLRAAVPLALRIGRVVAWIVALYAWLVFASTLSERTRPLGDRLAQALVDPAAEAVAALGRAIPLLVGFAVGAALVALVLRATRLWFEAVARGDARPTWISRDHARSTGALVRVAIVVLALLAAPGILGIREGGVGGVGIAALAALALGASPVAASLLLGVLAVYGGALRPGDLAEVGGRRGRVVEVTFREVVLEDAEGAQVRVPHLLALLHPTRVERRR
jgi:small-conductance mechanosensitive channel